MTRELFKMEIPKPGLPVLVLLFVVLFALGTGCTTDTALEEDLPSETNPDEEPAPEPDPEEEPVPEPEPEEGPVPFEVLRNSNSEASQRVVNCWFNDENIDPNSADEESLSALELVIGSKIDFDTYISCNDTVTVNFEEDLVLAGMTIMHPVRVLTTGLTVELVNDSIYFRIGLLSGSTHAPSRAEYIIKISGDYTKYPVIFDAYWED